MSNTPKTDDVRDAFQRGACGTHYIFLQMEKLERAALSNAIELSLALTLEAHQSALLRDQLETVTKERDKAIERERALYEKSQEQWLDSREDYAKLKEERDELAGWKASALEVESWWQKISDYVRQMPDAVVGKSVSDMLFEFLKERERMKNCLASIAEQECSPACHTLRAAGIECDHEFARRVIQGHATKSYCKGIVGTCCEIGTDEKYGPVVVIQTTEEEIQRVQKEYGFGFYLMRCEVRPTVRLIVSEKDAMEAEIERWKATAKNIDEEHAATLKQLNALKNAIAARLPGGLNITEYIFSQFPATKGHLPLGEYFTRVIHAALHGNTDAPHYLKSLCKRLLFAYTNPGEFTPRGDNFREGLRDWQNRAIDIAIDMELGK